MIGQRDVNILFLFNTWDVTNWNYSQSLIIAMHYSYKMEVQNIYMKLHNHVSILKYINKITRGIQIMTRNVFQDISKYSFRTVIAYLFIFYLQNVLDSSCSVFYDIMACVFVDSCVKQCGSFCFNIRQLSDIKCEVQWRIHHLYGIQ